MMAKSITPVGTCRIANSLRDARKTFDFDLNMAGIYGYQHSSGELIQQVRFLRGTPLKDKAAFPVLLSPNFRYEVEVKKVPLPLSDLYFVEISSLKELLFNDTYLQINYLTRHFDRFFCDSQRRSLFWRLCRSGNESDREEFLQSESSFLSYPEEERVLLKQLQFSLTSQEKMERDMREIMALLGRVVFFTHCLPSPVEGTRLETRATCVNRVKAAAEAVGADYFDPSLLMAEFGQERAFIDSDKIYAHYSPEFQLRLFEDWNERFGIAQPKEALV